MNEVFNSAYRLSSYLYHEKREKTDLLMNLGFFKPLFLNGADDFLSKLLVNKSEVLDNELLKQYPTLTKHLVDHKILIKTDQKEEDTFNRPIHSNDGRPYSRSVYMFVTQDCNLSCIYCLAGKNYKRKLSMSEDIAFKTIDLISDSVQNNGKVEIVFFGGEPMLNWRLIKKCVDYVEKNASRRHKDLTYRYHITTNMTMFPDDFISFIKSYKISLLTDIDGLPNHHDSLRPTVNGKGSYNTIIKNVQKLIDSQVSIAIRTTITSVNENYLPEICANHKKIGIEACAFPSLVPVNSDQKLIDSWLYPNPSTFESKLKEILRSKIFPPEKLHPVSVFFSYFLDGGINEYGCGMPYGSTIAVDAIGNIYPCIYLSGLNSFKLTNVNDALSNNSLLINNPFFIKYHNKFGVNHIEKCKRCIYKFACGGGCPILSLSIDSKCKEGSKAESNSRLMWCSAVKTSIQEIAWHIAKERVSQYNFTFPVC